MDDAPTHIRATHPYGFRCGQWAEIKCIVPRDSGDCWLVEFPDGVTDFWRVIDPDDQYEFRYDGVVLPEGEH